MGIINLEEDRKIKRESALECAARGWRMVPLHWPKFNQADEFVGCSCGNPDCDSPGKHPLIKAWQHNATTDIAQINEWLAQWPDANWAIATGEESNLTVVDVDINKTTGEFTGQVTLEKIIAIHGETPETLEVTTGSGGRQLYYLHPGIEVRNTQNGKEDATNLEFRGDGGYVVAVGSRHKSGRRYEWANRAKMQDLPTWALNWRYAKIDPLGEVEKDGEKLKEKIIDPKAKVYDQDGRVSSLSKYTDHIVKAETSRVRDATEGTRNNSLNRAAFSLGTLVGAGMLDESQAVAELQSAARSAGLKDPEIEKTIKSGLEAGKSKPRPEPQPLNGRPVAPPPVPPDEADEDTLNEFLVRSPKTDMGNAEVFAYLFGDRVRYCVNDKKWKIFNGAVWVNDETMRVDRLMVEALRRRRDAGNRLAAVGTTDAERENGLSLAGYAMRCENAGKIKDAIDRAKTLESIVTTLTQYDQDAFLITAGDVTINLRTGDTYAPRPTDYITKMLGVAYDPKADCPRWKQFIEEVWPNQPEMWSYIQRVVGYSLTGDMREEKLFMLLGKGSNGKSIFVDTIHKLVGDHYGNTPFTTFDADKRNEATNDLAALRGRRVISVSEVDEGKRLAEARVKMATTGIDTITCRFLYCEPFDYYPTFKVFMALNHLPGVSGTDDGIWRRIQLIKFGQRFWKPGDDRRPNDKDADLLLDRKLAQELPGILNWAIEGCMAWQEQGLNPPEAVTELTRQYRQDSDIVGLWADQFIVEKRGARLYSGEAYKSFRAWAEEVQGVKYPMSQFAWSKQMIDKGYNKAPKPDRNGAYFEDIGLAYESAPTVRFPN